MSLSIRQSLQGTHLFITGATGFLGLALVEKLLRHVPDCRLTLLVRGADDAAAKRRFIDMVSNEALFAGLLADAAARVDCIAGDITAPALGLSPGTRNALHGCIALVINSAASVDFDEPLDQAIAINIEGPLAVQAFASEIGAGLLHISTAYVCGDRSGVIPDTLDGTLLDAPAELRELQWLARSVCEAHGVTAAKARKRNKKLVLALSVEGRRHANSRGWPDIYTHTKCVAEHLLLANRGAQALGVFRPTIIESAAGGQQPGWLLGVKVMDMILAAYGKGMIPGFPVNLNVPLDVIPVDMVASAVLAQAADMRAQGEGKEPSVCQIGTSTSNPLLLRQVSECTYTHYRTNPLPDVRGKPIIVAEPRFPWVKNYGAWLERYLSALNATLWLLERRPLLNVASSLRRAVIGRQKNLRRYLALVKMFGSYANTKRRFATGKVDALFARLDEAERAAFDFAHGSIDWQRYLLEHHLPSLDRLLIGSNATSSKRAA